MTAFPTPLSAYPPPSPDGLVATFRDRLAQDPFSGAATTVFALAVLHSFAVAQLAEFAKHVQARHDAEAANAACRHRRASWPSCFIFSARSRWSSDCGPSRWWP